MYNKHTLHVSWAVGVLLTAQAAGQSGVPWRPRPERIETMLRQPVEYDLATGRASIRIGSMLLHRMASAVVLEDGRELLSADSNYTRTAMQNVSTDSPLPGELTVVTCKDTHGRVDIEQRFLKLNDRRAVIIETVARNVSTDDLLVRHIEPIRALLHENAGCAFPISFHDRPIMKVLTNGYLYYDSGQLLDFGPDHAVQIDSFTNATFLPPFPDDEPLIVGYLNNRDATGHILASWSDAVNDRRPFMFNLTTRSVYNDHFVIRPGASISSDQVLVLTSYDPDDPFPDEPFASLEYYAKTLGRLHNVRLNPIINGWCSWFVTYGQVSEEEVFKNAEFVAREMKPYGMEWIQIDDGFQRAFGDWEGNDRFPHGMKATADRIRALGLKPGLWLAPYAISEGTDVARNHPDWLAHEPDGQIQKIEPAHQAQAQYILDITHPQARQWLFDLFHKVTHDWGYDFIKIDFVEWTLLAARKYHDPTFSKAQAYRLGVQTMREAMGPDRHLLDCGPASHSIGLVDSMRIGLDRPYPENPLWDQYAGFPNSTISSVAKRYYFHNRTWINDPDHLRLSLLTIPQAQAAATIVGLSGGTTISGDRLYALDDERLAILKSVVPAYGQTARPQDLFKNPLAQVFVLEIRRPFARWWLLACFNHGKEPTTCRLDSSPWRVELRRSDLVYDFWSQRLASELFTGSVVHLEPTSVKLFVIRPEPGVPWVLGTDRHITQGGVELEDVRWNEETHTLSGTALGGPGTSWTLTLYVPEGYTMSAEYPIMSLTDLSFEPPLLRGRISFPDTDRRAWSIQFKRPPPRP